jgi:protein O-mannosyl-transferase
MDVSTRFKSAAIAVASALVVILTVGALFGRTVGFGLIEFDDQLHLTGNPFLQPDSPGRFAHFWSEPYGKLFIPVTYNLWAVLYQLGFDDSGRFVSAVPLRMANVLLHALNAAMVLAILRKLNCGRWGAVLGAMVFAVAPFQVESVAWVSEMRGLLATALALVAIACWLGGLRIIATVLVAAAMLSKPSAVAVPVVILSIDWLVREKSFRRAIVPLLPMTIIALGVAVMMSVWVQKSEVAGAAWWMRPLVAGDALAFYVWKLVWPAGLCADYSRTPELAMKGQWFWWAWTVPASIALASVWWKPLRAPAAIFAAGLLPVLGLVSFEFQQISTVADRYVYLSLLGPALLVGRLCASRWFVMASGAGVLAMFAISWSLVGVWRETPSLWAHAMGVNPRGVVAMCNVAEDASRSGEVGRARELFLRARQIDSKRVSPILGLANLARRTGEVAEAERLYREAIELDASDPLPGTDLGSLLLSTGRAAEAKVVLEETVRRNPNAASAWLNLASTQHQLGDHSSAMASLRRSLESNPRLARAHLLLAMFERDPRSAQTAAQLDPLDPEPLRWLGKFAADQRDWLAVIQWCERLLKLEPNDAIALSDLAQALANLGRWDEAIAAMERAVGLQPGSEALRSNLQQLHDKRPKP